MINFVRSTRNPYWLRGKIKSRRKYVYTFLLLLTVVRWGLLRIFYPEYTIWQQVILAVVSMLFMVFVYEIIYGINRWLGHKMPFEQGVLRRLVIQVFFCLAVTFSIHTLIILTFKDWLPAEFNRLLLGVSYFIDLILVIAINTAIFGIYFFEKWKLSLLKTERLERERTNAQYENLKNQLNPHFLFNSLSSLNSLIFENQELASQFLQQLSKVFRYVLENKDKELVNIAVEVQFVSRYIFLLRTRFGEALEIHFELNEEALSHRIVPVTLQILIENAIKHNSINDEHSLIIRVSADKQYLHVQNTLHKKTTVENSHKVGLRNLRSLYQYLSPLPVVVNQHTDTFTVSVPLL